MRIAAILIGCMYAVVAACSPADEAYRQAEPARSTVTIYSTTDRTIFEPVIEDFERLNPELSLEYVELDALPLYDRFIKESEAGRTRADIPLSSAMVLQVNLVNDRSEERRVGKE